MCLACSTISRKPPWRAWSAAVVELCLPGPAAMVGRAGRLGGSSHGRAGGAAPTMGFCRPRDHCQRPPFGRLSPSGQRSPASPHIHGKNSTFPVHMPQLPSHKWEMPPPREFVSAEQGEIGLQRHRSGKSSEFGAQSTESSKVVYICVRGGFAQCVTQWDASARKQMICQLGQRGVT